MCSLGYLEGSHKCLRSFYFVGHKYWHCQASGHGRQFINLRNGVCACVRDVLVTPISEATELISLWPSCCLVVQGPITLHPPVWPLQRKKESQIVAPPAAHRCFWVWWKSSPLKLLIFVCQCIRACLCVCVSVYVFVYVGVCSIT